MPGRPIKRNILQRIFGIPATWPSRDSESWSHKDKSVIVDLDRTAELAEPGGTIRLEGK